MVRKTLPFCRPAKCICPGSRELDTNWNVDIECDRDLEEAKSVVGRVPGGEGPVIIVGAHFDGLGNVTDEEGRQLTYEGADDNASGIAVLIESARRAAKAHPEAQVFFVATDAEERRLRGSRVVARFLRREVGTGIYVNMDMVGRMRDSKVQAFAPRLDERVRNAAPDLQIEFQAEGASYSDHIAFRDAGFDVIHLTTGRHADYHQVSDVVSKLDFSGMSRMVNFIGRLIDELAK